MLPCHSYSSYLSCLYRAYQTRKHTSASLSLSKARYIYDTDTHTHDFTSSSSPCPLSGEPVALKERVRSCQEGLSPKGAVAKALGRGCGLGGWPALPVACQEAERYYNHLTYCTFLLRPHPLSFRFSYPGLFISSLLYCFSSP